MIAQKNDIIYEKKKFNIFLALLRMYLSFLVVNAHLFNRSTSNIKNIYILKLLKNRISVPIFFIMSFYFCYRIIYSKNITRIRERFERMLIPYFIWPIIILILNNIYYLSFNKKLKVSLKDLLIQYKTGHNIVAVLWFQLNLIVSTLLILSIQLLFGKNIYFLLINIQIIAYFLQYSNINYNLFIKYDYYRRYPYGRFVEIIPHCITGYILASSNLLIYLKEKKIKSIFTLLIFLLFIIKYNIIINPKGFNYQGILLHIKSLIIFLIFAIFPSEKITNKNIIEFIKKLTNYTSGIYYLHIPISLYLSNFILLIKQKSIYGCLIIYIICYYTSCFGIIILGKTKLRHLFQ